MTEFRKLAEIKNCNCSNIESYRRTILLDYYCGRCNKLITGTNLKKLRQSISSYNGW